MKKSGTDKYFAPEYEVKTKNIKTGEHYQDRYGKHYTVVSVPSISSKDMKELALVYWEEEGVISMSKDTLVTHLNIVGAEKTESYTLPRQFAVEDHENCRWYKFGKGTIRYMMDAQKFQLFTELAKE